ncbi:hypothetical protein [Paenibacillus sp. OK003]|uniref:hypothetical protein n=1 Tax=Paenibacillus sp. OK003 TaxID=1884380 RepID=UPI001587270A|nr:hypothetical protein [Paenibacillus sp. OK003]
MGKHSLTIRVDNTDYPTKGGHLTSVDTQTNWNGITGKLELHFYHDVLDTTEIITGLRDFEANGDAFTINGRKTFLRRKHDGLIFPLTGYARVQSI